jgi:LacI family transcriptional regulator
MSTIKDVAREAGVSVATVSRVLNGSAPVREPTRQLVRDAAARLRYSPHVGARSLITSRTSTLGVLLPDLYGEFFSEVIRGIDTTARGHGYHLVVSSSHDDRGEIEAVLGAMRGRVDGLLVMAPDPDAVSAMATLPEGLPVVLMNSDANGSHDALTIQNVEGAAGMVRHLLALGHRRIAMITGAERNHDAVKRLEGYRLALTEAGIGLDPLLEVQGDFSESAGYAAALELLACGSTPTAIFAANDAMAIGALSALHERGMRVPRDMTVVGFDDIPMARYMNPPLSSVHVDISELGARATTRLLNRMREHRNGDVWRETLSTRLVVRQSCGPPPCS